MRKHYTSTILGICLIILGVILLGDLLGLFSVSIFFAGWWTLFIIVPSIIGLFSNSNRFSYAIFLVIGIVLLLGQQHIIPSYSIWRIILIAVIIILGIKLLISNFLKKKTDISLINSEGVENYTAIFGGQERVYNKEIFNGANLTAIFGGVDLDLRDAIIEHDIQIDANCIFGGCDILTSQNVNVKSRGTNIFGGIDNKVGVRDANLPTIYLNSTTLFGGIDIK